jgi:hypothetical protein
MISIWLSRQRSGGAPPEMAPRTISTNPTLASRLARTDGNNH